MKIPDKLIEIQNHLIKTNIKLSNSFNDGRINASINEDELLIEIEKAFSIDIPKSRAWYDFSFSDKKEFYPVNIKITNTTTADNLNCKLGIYFALTGLIPDFPNEINWLSYFEKLKDNLGKIKKKDYYFLIFNKKNPIDIFLNTLKGISSLQPNGNNLPFQCRWDSNRDYKPKTFDESKNFILKTFGESIKLRSEIYFNFKLIFPEYV